MGHDLAQDPILADALCRRVRVFDHITPPAVQHAVIATGGAVGKIASFDQYGLEAAHRQVAPHAGSSSAPPNDEHFGLNGLHGDLVCIPFMDGFIGKDFETVKMIF